MIRILILTKNTLSKKKLTDKLMFSNYEVFCSTSIYEALLEQKEASDLIQYFPTVVIDETISNSEMKRILPRLKEQDKKIVREIDQALSEKNLTSQDSFYHLWRDDSADSILSQFAQITSKSLVVDSEKEEMKVEYKDDLLVTLSPSELRVFNILSSSKEEYVPPQN